MPIYLWKPEYSVKIEIIDQQHKKLLDAINVLHDAMKKGKGKEVLSEIFDKLSDYIATHFATEEEFFAKYGYPELGAHKLEHDNFIKKIEELKIRFHEGKTKSSVDLSVFLSTWFHDHMLPTDKKYAKFLNEKGVY